MDIIITFKSIDFNSHSTTEKHAIKSMKNKRTYRDIEPKTLLIERGVMYFAHDTFSPAQYKIRLTDIENITMTF